MAEEEGASSSGTADPVALGLAGASREHADDYLRKQSRLADTDWGAMLMKRGDLDGALAATLDLNPSGKSELAARNRAHG